MMAQASEVEFRDQDGTGFTLLDYNGLLLPKRVVDPPAKTKDIKNLKYQDGDVFLCSFPKTGISVYRIYLRIRTLQLLTIPVLKINYPMCLKIAGWVANSVDPDETPRSAACHLGVRCLLRPVCPNTYGSHWLSALVSLLLRNVDIDKASVPRIPLIDVFDTEMLVTKPAPREISTHLRYEYLPSEHLQNKGKVILLLRNPKDVAVSFYHFCKVEYTLRYSGSWEYFLKLFLDGSVPYGSYFDYVSSWDSTIKQRSDHEILVVFYEDLKTDCLNQVRRISQYLGLTAEESRIKAVVERCSLKNLKEEVEGLPFTKGIHAKPGKSAIYRKGSVGDWKNQFSVAESEKFDYITEQKWKNSAFKFRYS